MSLAQRFDTARGWEFVSTFGSFAPFLDETIAMLLQTSGLATQALDWQPLVYALARLTRPSIIVETGVFLGASTHYLGAALERNQHGELYSCDPAYKSAAQLRARATHAKIALPKERWHFDGRKSAYALPAITAEPWDIFIHDSDHRRANMLFEMLHAWERMKPGGLMVVDDYKWTYRPGSEEHDAVDEFLRMNQPERISLLTPKTAVLVK